jgi:beta-galactosidase
MGIAPSIITQPLTQVVGAHSTVTFTVVADGDPILTYQWKKGVDELVGETADTLELVNVTDVNQGTYTVVVTNDFGSITSDDADLTVNTAPVVVLPPSSTAGEYNKQLVLEVVAVGDVDTALHYQWKKSGVNIGTDSKNYVIEHFLQNDMGFYTVTVTNTFGTVTSDVIELSMMNQMDAYEDDIRDTLHQSFIEQVNYIENVQAILKSKNLSL